MNQSHVIDSWIAELALGSRANRPRSAAAGAPGARPEPRRLGLKPVERRVAAFGKRARPARASLRRCLSGV